MTRWRAAPSDGATLGTLLGGALGAAIGAAAGNPGLGAAVGAGSGLVLGTATGANAGAYTGMSMQQRYDTAYTQCMYAKGNQVPTAAQWAPRRTGYAAPPPPPPAAAGECPRAAFGRRPGTSATTAGSTPATPAPVAADSREDGKAKARFRRLSGAGLVLFSALAEAS